MKKVHIIYIIAKMTIIIKYGNRLIIDNQRDQRNADISPNIPHTIDTDPNIDPYINRARPIAAVPET